MRVLPSLFVVATSLFDHDYQPPAFPGALRITQMPAKARPSTIDVFCHDERTVRAGYDAATDRAIYLWGRVAHPTVSATPSLLKWCADAAAEGAATGLRQLHGPFVLIVDDRRRREVVFASDVLGVRPWFVRQSAGGLVAGSDVLALHDAGYGDGILNYDAISSWVRYNYDLTGGSVLKQFDRLAPGAVVHYDATGRELHRTDYATFSAGSRRLDLPDTLAGVHERVRHAFQVTTRDLQAVTLPLSGGYDSRYLLALGAERRPMWTTAVNVRSSPAESAIALRVGDVLGQTVKVLPSDGHTLDLFDDPFSISPGGFPAGRNLASAVARRHPGTPVLSGFLGDLLVRGSADRCLGRLPDTFAQSELSGALERHHAFKINRLDLLRPGLAGGIRERSSRAMARLAAGAPAADKSFVYASLFGRQRFYIANIFLQHLDSAEAILPFYSWDLIDFKMSLAPECFSFENYPRLFSAYFPELSAIPHNSSLEMARPAAPPRTRHLRPWTVALVKDLFRRTGVPTMIDRRKLLRRLPGGLGVGRSRHDELLFLYKVLLFERTLREHRLSIDWGKI